MTFNESGAPPAEIDAEPCTIRLVFGFEDEEERVIQAELQARENQIQIDQIADQIIEPDLPAAPNMPQVEQATAEENARDGRQLRDRRRSQAPERYGVPIAYLADVQDMTFDDVVSSDHADQWKSAMNEEIQALQENNTWSLCSLPAGKQAIGCNGSIP